MGERHPPFGVVLRNPFRCAAGKIMFVEKGKTGAATAGHRSHRAARFTVKRVQNFLDDRRKPACRRFKIISCITEIANHIPQVFQNSRRPRFTRAGARIQAAEYGCRG